MTRISVVGEMIDVTRPRIVEVELSDDGRVWINVDGKCLFRACRCGMVVLKGPNGGYIYKEEREKNSPKNSLQDEEKT